MAGRKPYRRDMRYGIGIDTGKPLPEVVEQARRRAAAGFSYLTLSHIFAYDALSLVAAVGPQVPAVGFTTAVVPIYTRHPIAMAQEALTVQAALHGRFSLGIGLSHKIVIETMYGLDFAKPLRDMTEYLAVLMPLLRGEHVSFEGETVQANIGPFEIPDSSRPQVIVAALGSGMLKLAGAVADGTTTWMTGPNTLRDHIVPTIRAAAEQAGRPKPRVMAALPISVTSDVAAAREKASTTLAVYGQLPSYRAMLDREGAAAPGDVALAGTEAEVRAALEDLDDAGVTDFAGMPVGTRDEVERTLALLAELASA